MLNTIKTNLLLPLLGRVGTTVATILVGYGLQAEPAQQLGALVAAGGGVVFDLVVDWWVNRKPGAR